jgi:thioredoxin 1
LNRLLATQYTLALSDKKDAAMATMDLTKENFEQTVGENPIVVVDFWAPWCGPCRSFAPVFEKASESHPDVVFAKVNSDEQQELAGAFNIRSIPTLMVFREKVILFQQAGALPGQALEQVLTQAKSLDMAKVHQEIAAQSAASGEITAQNAGDANAPGAATNG